MKSKKPLVVVIAIALLAIGWAAFRPELLFVNERVNESFPQAGAASAKRTLASGSFHSGAHETKGEATIHQLEDGSRILRLSGFSTSNGPDVRVLLVAAADATDNDTVKKAGYIELGKLKGNMGDQNYEVPAEANLDEHRSVTIWCNRFSVNFGTAPLARR